MRNQDGAYGKIEATLISEAWDDEKDFGLILMEFDPELQTREDFNANRRASHFWGLTNDDLMDQFKKNQVPLQLTELDWVRMFSVYLSRFFSDSVKQYLRFTLGLGSAARCALVCMTTSKTFNQFGRISQARLMLGFLLLFFMLCNLFAETRNPRRSEFPSATSLQRNTTRLSSSSRATAPSP
jgi:hypothetical protein